MASRFFNVFCVLLLGGVFGLVGMGFDESLTRLFGFSILLLILVFDLLQEREIRFPKLFFEYLVFLGVFGASIWWSLDQAITLNYWLLFASMPVVWLLAFNHQAWVKRYFFGMMIGLGMFFLAGTLLSHTWEAMSFLRTTPRGLMGSYSVNSDHYMLGDFWAVIWVMVVARYLKDRSNWMLPILVLGLPIVVFSLSRSALVAVGFSLWVMIEQSERVGSFWRKAFWWLAGIATLYMATQKPVLMNRPYYVQSILGFFEYPFGVGVGNFEIISSDPRFHLLGLSGYSKVVHSILLEFLSGMGILVVVWWDWCRRFFGMFLEKMYLNVYQLGLLALVVDMVFNPTYFVTTMWWMLGVFMAILGSDEEVRWKNSLNSWSFGAYCVLVLVGGLWSLL